MQACAFSSYSNADHLDLHSFPTRRSSDLGRRVRRRRTQIGHPQRVAWIRSLLVRDDEPPPRSEEHTSELQSHVNLVCRLLPEKKKQSKCRVSTRGMATLFCSLPLRSTMQC